MLIQGIRYMKGYVRIRMIGYSAERFLNACAYRNIYIWGLRTVNGNYELNIYARDFLTLKPILKKTGIQVRILKKTGFPFWLHRYRKRRMFFFGAAGSVTLIILFSSIIWNIDISGNLTRSDDTLLRFLRANDVKSGMLKTQVDCERIVKDIRKEYDDIVWVSASVEGSRLKIQIKENEDADLNIENGTVDRGQLFDVPVMGTHAHSWIMSFPDEYTAFKAYADLYPDNCTLLVDTYDTLKSGVPNAIRVFQEYKDAGKTFRKYGIRLDSGDLAYLSKQARKMLDEAGFPDATICASNDLDEYLLHDLKMQGAAINSWGVGTNLITSKDCPSFGGVYKLSAIQNEDGEFVPKIKISENTEKITNPGNKTIYRIYEKETGKIKADLISFADETFDENEDLLLFDPTDTWKKTKLAGGTYTIREILVPVFRNGECIYQSPSVTEIAEYCKQEKETLWDETKRLFYPHRVYVDLSSKLYDVKKSLLDEMNKTE